MSLIKYSEEEITTLLTYQDQLNKTIDPNWVPANWSLYRAIYIEAAEAIDHYNWEWWKEKKTDEMQVFLELIDILHFTLADIIRTNGGHIDLAADAYLESVTGRNSLMRLSDKRYEKKTVIGLLEEIIAVSILHSDTVIMSINIMAILHILFGRMGYTKSDILRVYIGKYCLNGFRQDNGYREGLYQRDWNGEDDNDVLARGMEATFNEDIETYREQLYAYLEKEYAKVKK